MTEMWLLVAGLAACFAAILLAFVAVLRSQPGLSKDRKTRNGVATSGSALAGPAQRLASALDRLAGPARSAKLATALDLAGLALRPGDYQLIVSSSMLAALAVGLIVSGWILAVLLTLATPLVATKYLTFRTGRRRAAFADQLDDSLQLLSGRFCVHAKWHGFRTSVRRAAEVFEVCGVAGRAGRGRVRLGVAAGVRPAASLSRVVPVAVWRCGGVARAACSRCGSWHVGEVGVWPGSVVGGVRGDGRGARRCGRAGEDAGSAQGVCGVRAVGEHQVQGAEVGFEGPELLVVGGVDVVLWSDREARVGDPVPVDVGAFGSPGAGEVFVC